MQKLFLIIFYAFVVVRSQDPCSSAPTEALRFVCHHIHKWDKNARASQARKAVAPFAPGFAGMPLAAPAAELAPVVASLYSCMDLACVCQFLSGTTVAGGTCQLSNGQSFGKAIRKEYRMLTDDERQRFHYAIRQLKRNGEYDWFARIHSEATDAGSAHAGPAFLPWHREFLKRFELAIRQIDPTLAVPYWDSRLEQNLQNPRDSIIFTQEFMGETDTFGGVVSGPFTPWRTISGNATITRQVGRQGKLYDDNEVLSMMQQTNIESILAFTAPQAGCPIRVDFNAPEYTHGNPHIFVGGDMFDTVTSANDPIFFIHHSFVDYLWEYWRQSRQTRANREIQYPPDRQQCSSAQHFASSVMGPFEPMRNIDGLSNKYTDELYQYAPKATCYMQNPECGSPYLFCDFSQGFARCTSKIRVGAFCGMYTQGENPCYNGQCFNGQCVFTGNSRPDQPRQHRDPGRRIAPLETCFNENKCCSYWASTGECTRNARYMQVWCKASCGQCHPQYRLADECDDRHQHCASWSREGECGRNVPWMSENCRRSCGMCDRSRNDECRAQVSQEVKPLRCENSRGDCKNENICCSYWSLLGGCPNSIYMACYCRVSCGYCVPQDYYYGSCDDYSPNCAEWAASGECDRNPWMAENCRASCNSCSMQRELPSLCGTEPGYRSPLATGRRALMFNPFNPNNFRRWWKK